MNHLEREIKTLKVLIDGHVERKTQGEIAEQACLAFQRIYAMYDNTRRNLDDTQKELENSLAMNRTKRIELGEIKYQNARYEKVIDAVIDIATDRLHRRIK